MQFLDIVTIFHSNEGVYERKVVSGCYWYGSSGIITQGNGIVRDDSLNVFFPKKNVEKYAISIQKGDRIVKGDVPEIKSVNELVKYEDKLTVTTVNVNSVGSRLDNILITGK